MHIAPSSKALEYFANSLSLQVWIHLLFFLPQPCWIALMMPIYKQLLVYKLLKKFKLISFCLDCVLIV